MRAKHAFIVLVALVSSVRHARSNDIPVGMYDHSAGMTMNKGNELAKKGDYEKARQYYDAAISRDPKEWPAYYSRARVLIFERQWQLALQDLNSCIRLKPSFFMATIMRGWVNERLGKYSSSLADYERILSLRPMENTRAMVLNSRAWLRATCPDSSFRNGQQAIADAKNACDITSWGKPEYIDTLAAACAATGDFDAAVRYEEKASALYHDAASSTDAQRRLAMYRQHQPLGRH